MTLAIDSGIAAPHPLLEPLLALPEGSPAPAHEVAASAPEASSPFTLRLFGPFEARVGGAPRPWIRKRKGEWLLALLALRSGAEVERGWLAGTLWPESGEAQGLTNLRASLANLRRALGAEAGRMASPSPRTLALDLAGATVDVLRFDAALAREDAAGLGEAVSLYRGPLLEGCCEEWAFQERQMREQAYLAARERLAALALEQGEIAEAERHLRLAVAVDPLRESVQCALMQVLAAGGNYAAALQCYRELRGRLHRELNLEPGPETQTLFQQLRSEARGLGAKSAGVSRRGGTAACAKNPTGNCENAKISETAKGIEMGMGSPRPAPPSQPAFALSRPFALSQFPAGEFCQLQHERPAAALREALKQGPLVGRDAELAVLMDALDAALAGAGSTLFVAGEAGIGKSRLAAEAGAYARSRGFQVLTGWCDEQGAAPYQPLAEALRDYLETVDPASVEQALPPPVACELGRIVPRIASQMSEIRGSAGSRWIPSLPAGPGTCGAGEHALADALRQFFALITRRDAPVLLLLEDLHWADEGSLALLKALSRAARGLRLLILGTYRDTEVDLQHPLARTRAALNRERLSQRVSLRRLSEPAAAAMAAALLGEPLSPPFLTVLYHQTEGNPFFIEELLKHLIEEGAIYRDEGRWLIQPLEELSLPPSIKVAIGRRLERLTQHSREVLTLAAVMGEQFRFEGLLATHRQAGTRLDEERLLEIVEEWLRAHLVVEQRASGVRCWVFGVREGQAASDPTPHIQHRTPNTQHLAPHREQYRFQHALIREVLYEALSLRRRARLHEQVGLALEAVMRRLPAPGSEAPGGKATFDSRLPAPGSVPTLGAGSRELGAASPLGAGSQEPLEELAHHFSQACSRTGMERGVTYCLRAGEKARYLYANEAAIRHLMAALNLLDELPADEPHLRQRCEVVKHLWRAYKDAQEYERARDVVRECLALAERIGDPWGMAAAHDEMSQAVEAGAADRESARRLGIQHGEECLRIAGQHRLTEWRVRALVRLADLQPDDPARAEALLREALDAPEGVPADELRNYFGRLMYACALQGKWGEVAPALRRSISYGGPWLMWLDSSLSVMEGELNQAGKVAEYLAFCDEARALFAQAGLHPALEQWYLEPAPRSEGLQRRLFRDEFEAPKLRSEWQWHDPVQVSAYSLSERPGHLTLRAGPGTDLWAPGNLNAPRMLLEVRGDFALETKMEANWEHSSGMSGLLLWKDVLNYVRLDKNSHSRFYHGVIRFEARVAGVHEIHGRGQLPGESYHLRLERTGERVTALCSTNGVHWLTCGRVSFPVKDPLWVGVWAGRGMVAHFDWVQVLGRQDQ